MTTSYNNILSDARCVLSVEIERNDIRNVEGAQDLIHEIADDHVPVYYKQIFEVMASEGISPEFEDAGMIPNTTDVTIILQARIYEQLVIDLYEDLGGFLMDYIESLDAAYQEEYDAEEEEAAEYEDEE